MIVPQYWAETRIRERVGGRQVTVLRFGWSDSSQEEAQRNANARAREAIDRIAAGEKVTRREPRIPYNGADGVPIREEIVERYGDAVVTRNSYGARCLNTPDVLFADVDFQTEANTRLVVTVTAILVSIALIVAWILQSWGIALVAGSLALVAGAALAQAMHSLAGRIGGGLETRARSRIEQFITNHPDWHLRVYRTPAGFRVLAMQQTFDPRSQMVSDFFQALATDPNYARMCRKQNCFRARVSAKPWRIGIETHMRPRPGVWPVDPVKMPLRTRWVTDYERTAKGYAACRFVASLGSDQVAPETRSLQLVHDRLCSADSELPLA